MITISFVSSVPIFLVNTRFKKIDDFFRLISLTSLSVSSNQPKDAWTLYLVELEISLFLDIEAEIN